MNVYGFEKLPDFHSQNIRHVCNDDAKYPMWKQFLGDWPDIKMLVLITLPENNQTQLHFSNV